MCSAANVQRYQADLEKLVRKGAQLELALMVDLIPGVAEKIVEEERKKLPKFKDNYQQWYSEALRLVVQILPDRVDDFVSYYKSSRVRKEIISENYTISDYLKGFHSKNRYTDEYIADPRFTLPAFKQQTNIVGAIKSYFESSLFEIRSIVQADLFDNELDASDELNKKGFQRGAGAVAGVVLEGHLATVGASHRISLPKNPTISKLNDLLKDKDVLDVPTWRFIQRLGDLRNLCDHKRADDPTKEQMQELIEGVRKITKTVF